jgi:hypothetical protein
MRKEKHFGCFKNTGPVSIQVVFGQVSDPSGHNHSLVNSDIEVRPDTAASIFGHN